MARLQPVAPEPVVAENEDERNALMHLRGHRHYAPTCPLCKAWEDGRQFGRKRAIDQIASGS